MAASLTFWGKNNQGIVGGSGIGFYGSNFSDSVAVGDYQGTTFITNAAGTAQGPALDNFKWANAQSGYLNSASSGIPLWSVPNAEATFRIQFTNDTAVKTQNIQLRTYDRTTITSPMSGTLVKVAEIRHPDPIQTHTGSGTAVWVSWNAATGVLALTPGVGSGGLSQGPNTVDTRHDWFVVMSLSPNDIGSKLGAVYVSLEYL